MNTRLIENIAAAVLYEGYLLYPYRHSAVKNRQRWNFGVLYPRAYVEETGSDAWMMQTECLLRADDEAEPNIRVRFLQLEGDASMQSAREREISVTGFRLGALSNATRRQRMTFLGENGRHAVEATVEVKAERIAEGVFKLRVSILNETAHGGLNRGEALLHALVSAHTILRIDGGEFVSAFDPADDLREAVAACRNIGTWPVLAGEEGSRDAMLSSPIILYDYPQIAPESPGALFDGTEIDEILTLRIMTLTDEEKAEMAQADERTREILARTEAMPQEQFMKLHGVLRGLNKQETQ